MALTQEEQALYAQAKAEYDNIIAARQGPTATQAVAAQDPNAKFISDAALESPVANAAKSAMASAVPGGQLYQAATESQLGKTGMVGDPGAGPMIRVQEPNPQAPSTSEVQARLASEAAERESATPTADMIGTLGGMAASTAVAEPLVQMAKPIAAAGVQAVKHGVRAIGETLINHARDVSAATIGMSKNEIVNFGLDKVRKLGDYLIKIGATNRPAMLSTVKKEIEATKESLGKHLDGSFKKLSEDAATHQTKQEMMQEIIKRESDEFAKAGLPLEASIKTAIQERIEQSLPNIPMDTKLTPWQQWQLAQKWEAAAKADYGDAEKSMQKIVNRMAKHLRDRNAELASAAADPRLQSLPTAGHTYHLLSSSSDGLTDEIAKSRMKANPVSLEGLKKVWTSTVGSQPVRGGYTGATYWTGEKLAKLASSEAKEIAPWRKLLTDASARGAGAIAATHYMLYTSKDPKYREYLDKLAEKEAKRGQKAR